MQYDYLSVMHYGDKAFSRNGQPTIVAKQPTVKSFGNTHLSVLDIKQANLLYKCPGLYFLLIINYYRFKLNENRGDFHVERSGVLVGNFELNL